MRISVIVPARNAAATIDRTLAAIAAQDLDEPFELVVVDDCSSDDTAIRAQGSPAAPRVVRHREVQGPGPARNTGVESASGELLAFTDADCFPTPSWLRHGVDALTKSELVQGAVRPDPGVLPRPFDRSVWVGAEVGLYETANLLVTRDLFERLGGFEDWLGARIGKPLAEDVWFGWRARRSGARTQFCPEALVHHAVFRRTALAWAGERARLTYFPDIVEKVPELRDELLFERIFLNRRTAAFDAALAAAAIAIASRSLFPLAGTLPYLLLAARNAGRWGRRAPLVGAAEILGDGVGFVALASGTARRRTIVL